MMFKKLIYHVSYRCSMQKIQTFSNKEDIYRLQNVMSRMDVILYPKLMVIVWCHKALSA